MNSIQSHSGQINSHQIAAANTDTMEKPKQVIDQAKVYLNDYKQTILKMYQDHRLTQWEKTNFDHFSAEFNFFGLPSSLETARDHHKKLSISILRQIEQYENELGAIDLDIKRNAISPQRALALAEKSAMESADLEVPMGEWNGYIRSLLNADKLLREKFTVSAIYPLALAVADKNKKDMIEDGYAFFLALTMQTPKAGDEPTLQGYFSQAVQLEKILLDIDLNGLTGLPAAIINHQIKTALAATDQLKLFIEELRKNLPGECQSIDNISKQLSDMRSDDINVCLDKMESLTTILSKNLVSLRHKRKSFKQFEYLPLILQEVKNFHEVLTTRIIPDLKEKISKPGSPLNPMTMAADLSTEYFTGLKGFIRAMKHLIRSIGGQQAIRFGDLQEKIFKTITSCDTYYGNTEADVCKIQTFIDEQLYEFSKPFPYEPLFQLLKRSISSYGSKLEKYLLGCRIDSGPVPDENGTVSSLSKGGTLGRLLQKIEIRTANLGSTVL